MKDTVNNRDGISEDIHDAGDLRIGSMTIQALLNRYILGTKMMRDKSMVVENSRELGLRQRERTVEFILQLLLANNGNPVFKTQLSTANMEDAREYILHGGDIEA